MAKKMKMSQLTEDLHIYPQVLVNVKVKDKAVAQADKDVQNAVQEVVDALGDTGRILVRESGTEPLIRVMVEAETEEICRRYVDNVVSVIKEKRQHAKRKKGVNNNVWNCWIYRKNQAAPVLLDGLSKLEYRGYDSAGIAVRDGDTPVDIVKAKGRLKVWLKNHGGTSVPGTCGIGHTRWATHGETIRKQCTSAYQR